MRNNHIFEELQPYDDKLENDKALKEIASQLNDIKEITLHIAKELDVQSEKMDQIYDVSVDTNAKVQQANCDIKDVSNQIKGDKSNKYAFLSVMAGLCILPLGIKLALPI